MKEIPLTNFQFIAYFIPGIPFVFSFFIINEQVNSLSTLITRMKDLSISILVISVIFSFVAGLVFDAFRNGLIEWIFDKAERNIPSNKKINWNYFYKAKKEDVGMLYARYFTYYCFDFNLAISILISVIMIDVYSIIPCKTSLTVTGLITILFLIRDWLSLRKDIVDVTNS